MKNELDRNGFWPTDSEIKCITSNVVAAGMDECTDSLHL